MRFFPWENKQVTDADLFVAFSEEEMAEMKSLFPEAAECCCKLDDYYGFVDTKRKLFIPLNNPSMAFGGQYGEEPPYGAELNDCQVDFKKLTWEPHTEYECKRKVDYCIKLSRGRLNRS